MERRHGKQKVADYSGSSEHLKKDIDFKKTVDVRLRIFLVFLACIGAVLIYRVFDITVINGDHYSALLEKFKTPPIYAQTMRGEMYDRNMDVLVTNKATKSIVYKNMNHSSKQKEELGILFAKSFGISYDLSEDELKINWLQKNGITKLATEQETEDYKANKITDGDFTRLMKSRITQEMLDTLSEEDKLGYYMLNKMNAFENGQSTIIENATVEQISYLSEHSAIFPGFSYTTTWARDYNKDIKLGGLFGSIGSIQASKLQSFLALGYAQNDKVGTMGLEYQYESILSGIDTQYQRGTGNSLTVQKDGRKGYDLRLSIDLDLQKFVEQAVQEAIESVRKDPNRQIFEEMHMVVSNPNNGDILAIVAIKRNEDGTYWNDVQSTMLSTGTYPVGSVAKIGTVYMSLTEGVVDEKEKILDVPMYIQGTPVRTSWKAGIGYVDARRALEQSSNIYMYHMAIRLAGTRYVPNAPLVVKDVDSVYKLMRKYYSKFGLGVLTQVDYPREEIGFQGSTNNTGNILDFAIGQFDNYNVMQLSQYVNTVANGGHRVAPRFLVDALEHDTKNVVFENDVKILNTLEDKHALKVVQEGMHQYIVNRAGYALGNETYTMAGKSGTAQDWKNGQYVRNSTYILYAPYEKPQVSISCIAPAAMLDSKGAGVSNICGITSTKVMTYYMTREGY